jgi:NADPH-dependent curcumin reductase CurA
VFNWAVGADAGWTAYVGMKTIGAVAEGDQVLVSGAAGFTGLLAVLAAAGSICAWRF